MTRSLNRGAAKQNPETAFASPMDIVAECKLTRGEKVATLNRWRQSLIERIGASDDGMRTRGHSSEQAQTLDLIEQAKQLLTRTKGDLLPPVATAR